MSMSNPSRKQIARALREQGNVEAALAVMLDYKPGTVTAADDDDGDAPTQGHAHGRPVECDQRTPTGGRDDASPRR